MNFIDSFLCILIPLNILSSDGLPERKGSGTILISQLHMCQCEFDDNVEIISCDRVTMFAELIHDLVCSFSLFRIIQSWDHMLEGEIAVINVLEYMSQERNTISYCH